jgi:SpoVK/Ycf46/Vps4 family AAA+-type ATPase
MNDIGGLAALKEYAAMRRASFSSEARAYGLPAPRGFLMVGVPGAGKSLTAKASTGGQMPLLRLDVAALMGSLVGQSEQNARSALRVAEAIAPCVLWIDEIEKGFAGMQGGELDGGTSRRMLGTILTWMQEHTSPVYVIATCNDVTSLPPELLSRFDDLWYVALPNKAERAEIISIHISKRGRNPEDFDLPLLAEATEGYVGREIEKIVVSALNRGFVDGVRPITTDDLLWAAKRIVPLSKTTPEKLAALHKWAEGRARNASGEGDESEATTTKRARKLEL